MLTHRRVLLPAISLVAFFCANSLLAAEKWAVVNMELVFDGYYKTAKCEAALKQQETLYEDHAKELAGSIELLRKKRDELKDKSLNAALSDTVRENCRKEAANTDMQYQEKGKELRGFMQEKKKELQSRLLEERKVIVQELKEFLADFAKREGLTFVFDRSGLTSNLIPVVIYADDAYDITETVSAELNRGHEDEVRKPKEGDAKDDK